MLSIVKNNKTMKLVVAAAQDKDVVEAVTMACEANLVEPILVGDETAIRNIIEEMDISYDLRIINEPDVIQSAKLLYPCKKR